jgi:hypothetical protein
VVEFLVDPIRIDPSVRARYHLRNSTQASAPAASVGKFKSAIDRVLDIDFVEMESGRRIYRATGGRQRLVPITGAATEAVGRKPKQTR